MTFLGTIPKFKQELASLFAGLRVGQAGVPRADKTSGPRADKTSGPCVDLFGNDLHGSVFDSYETDDHIYAEPDDVDD